MTQQTFRAAPASRAHNASEAWGQPLRYINRMLRAGITDAILQCKLEAGQRVLVFGCADRPYMGVLPQGCEYVGADLPGNPAAQVLIEADGTLPVADNTFDLVLSTQVLEHAADPALYLSECLRVLKPGGHLVLSTHGIMIWHPDPNDFWRWTCEGLQHEIRRSGLDVERFDGIMGLASTGLQLFQDATLRRLHRRLRRPFAALMQILVGFFDRRVDRDTRHLNALVFVATARKPLRTPDSNA